MKYAYYQQIEDGTSLPPCGGSGLKCYRHPESDQGQESPSMRREWIEILPKRESSPSQIVSLHAEGVD